MILPEAGSLKESDVRRLADWMVDNVAHVALGRKVQIDRLDAR